MEINKIRLKPSMTEISYSEETDLGMQTATIASTDLVHDDFLIALDNLTAWAVEKFGLESIEIVGLSIGKTTKITALLHTLQGTAKVKLPPVEDCPLDSIKEEAVQFLKGKHADLEEM